MALQPALEDKLAKIYAPATSHDAEFRGKDITFITNKVGEPITLFIGKRQPDGSIKGERYVRIIQYEADGITIRKSHWELKGSVSQRRK